MKNKLIRTASLLIAMVFLQACESGLPESVYTTEVDYTDYKSDTKQLRFVKMHHIGKKEFYNNVSALVEKAKNENYVLYYEWIKFDLSTEIEKRKIRKLTGFIPSEEGYRELISMIGDDSLVVQDNNQFLGLVNNKDYLVDITHTELLDKFEQLHGKLILSEADLEAPIKEFLDVDISESKVNDVLLTERNKIIVEHITTHPHSKIIVLYGANHEEGVIELLKQENPSWYRVSKNIDTTKENK